MRSPAFVWTCPACGKLVRTELPASDDAVLRCPQCGKVFGEDGGRLADGPSREPARGQRLD